MVDTKLQVRGVGQYYNASHFYIDENVNKGLGNKTAIYYRDTEITYSQLLQQVNQAGNMLKGLGVGLENRVLLACYDSPQFITTFYGAVKIGAVPIPVNTMMTPSDYEYFLNNSRAKVLVVQDELWEGMKHIKNRFLYLENVIVISDTPVRESDVYHFESLLKTFPSNLEMEHTTFDDPAFWLFSSGSTGNPKGVVHLHHDMEFSFKTYGKKVLKINEDDRTFSASKLFFAYGLGNGMHFPLGAGASTVLLPDRPTPQLVFETIEKYKPTIFFGVPTLYGAMLDQVEKSGNTYDLSSLRMCVSAGEALPATYIKKWQQLFNVDILDGIGSTEALHIFISNQIGDVVPGSSGRIVPGYEAKIVNEMGVEVSANETGDLLIKGDSIAGSYWNLHEENKKKFIGEWFHTGDKYYQDEQGYFWYCGRSDDMLKVGGIWVSPIEIENSLLEHESVLEVAVIGVEDDNNLVKPKAYVTLRDNVAPTEQLKEELKEFVKSDLAPYKYPRLIEFIDDLPKTATGKIQRFKLRASE